MNALLVGAVLAAVFLLLNLSRVTFLIRFRDGFSLRVGYLFFHYTVYPRPPKKEKGGQQAQRAAEEPEKPSGPQTKIRELLERKGLSGFLSVLREAGSTASGTAKRFFGHLGVDRFLLAISVGGGDAAQTAVEYGTVCAAVGTAAGAILSQVKCRKWSITIDPDFSGRGSSVRFDMKAGIRLVFLLAAAVYGLIRAIKISRSLKGKAGA